MAIGRGLAPSGYDPTQPGLTAPIYDPTQGQPLRAFAGGGGGSSTPGIVEYRPPAYDESQIKAYQQEALAPGISGLRRVMREAQAGRYSSPSARREALRGVTRGYGEALAPLQVGAGAQARQRYNIQYQQAIMAEQQRVAAEERVAEREYQESLREEAKAEQKDRVIRRTGYNAVGPEWTGHSVGGYYSGGAQVVGLTEASRRPISDEPAYIGLQPQPVSPGPAYPENWMT
jgi:hypothetical protein